MGFAEVLRSILSIVLDKGVDKLVVIIYTTINSVVNNSKLIYVFQIIKSGNLYVVFLT